MPVFTTSAGSATFFRHHRESWHCKHWINCLLSLLEIYNIRLAPKQILNGWFIRTKYSTSNMTLALDLFSKGKPLTWNCKSQPMQTPNCQHVLSHLGWIPRIHAFVLFKSFNEEVHQFSSYSFLQHPGKRVLSFTGQTLNLT